MALRRGRIGLQIVSVPHLVTAASWLLPVARVAGDDGEGAWDLFTAAMTRRSRLRAAARDAGEESKPGYVGAEIGTPHISTA